MISKFFFKIKLIPQKDIRVLLLSIAFSALLFLALTPLHVASNDINAGNLLFSWIAVIISGTALIGSIYFLLRQQDNLTIVNVRPCAVITANSEYVIHAHSKFNAPGNPNLMQHSKLREFPVFILTNGLQFFKVLRVEGDCTLERSGEVQSPSTREARHASISVGE